VIDIGIYPAIHHTKCLHLSTSADIIKITSNLN